VRRTIAIAAAWILVAGTAGLPTWEADACYAQSGGDVRPKGPDTAETPLAPPRERVTPQPPYQPPVNFSSPPREYETVQVHSWTVLVEKQLLQQDKELAKKALDRLTQQLEELMRRLPKPSQEQFRKLTLFLMFGERSSGGGRDNGLEYFQKHAPQHYSNLDPRMASSILIYSADNYVWLPERRALMALAHEFAHAYQLEQWPENEPTIYDTWQHAMDQKLYHTIKDENGAVLEQGYAAVNQLEYFAELSMVYFVSGYYTPLTRDELKSYDPSGYDMVRKMWRVDDIPPDQPAGNDE
jgi:hypothetical protein